MIPNGVGASVGHDSLIQPGTQAVLPSVEASLIPILELVSLKFSHSLLDCYANDRLASVEKAICLYVGMCELFVHRIQEPFEA